MPTLWGRYARSHATVESSHFSVRSSSVSSRPKDKMETMTLTIAVVLIALAALAGCTYNHKHFPTESGPLTGPDEFLVQVDDFGQFWDKGEAARALIRVAQLAKTTNVIVVAFVHGWNHNAAPDDENLRDFAKSMADTRFRLIDAANPESAIYRASRDNLTGTENLSVVSIYIGWRGRSLPWILNYATFWDRKAIAERVGEGDIREFLLRLNGLYRNQQSERRNGKSQTFMGLTTFGHSFGGQVLFRAVSTEIENELIARTGAHGNSDTTSSEVSDLSGFGDLVVLINPAFEAMQFERISQLSGRIRFGKQQNPVLLVVSSAGDVARQILFPIGRQLDAIFLRPGFRPGQRALWTQALGEYEPTRTHQIDILDKHYPLTPAFDPSIYLEDACSIASLDLTNVPSIAGVRLTPNQNHRANNPFIVAHASTSVVLDHSTVFETTLRKFLNDYVAIAQGKRILLNRSLPGCK